MLSTLTWIVFILGLFSLAFFRASARNWLIISAGLLFLLSVIITSWVVIIFWVIWAFLLLVIMATGWRMQYVTKPVLAWFKRVQPAITESEQEVLDAGGVWWEGEIFTGSPDWEKLLHTQRSQLTVEEQAFIDGPVTTLCEMLNDWQIKQDNDLPAEVWSYIKRERFWGLEIKKEFGGLEFTAVAHSTIIATIASRSMSAAISVMVPNSLGPASFIMSFGTDQQKQYYLPRLAKGEEVPCFALTSPEAGSDATSITDRGIVCRDTYEGKSVLGVRLNFNKRYITLAPIATLIGLAFKCYDPDHLLGETEAIGITTALIPAHLPGVTVGARHQPLTMSFMNGPIYGEDVFIPMTLIVGDQAGLGRGWQMMMDCLAVGRGISLPSLAAAANQFCFRAASAYSTVRRQFKRAIGDFEGVSQALAEIGGFTYLAESTRVFTARAVDAGAKPSIASAIAKYHLTELARKSVNHAMDIHGGKAIQDGPKNYMASMYNAIPIAITVEGANILTRNLIIFGQGVVRCHPYLADEMKVLDKPEGEEQLKQFDRLLLKHIGFTISQTVKSLVYGLTGGRLIGCVHSGPLKPYLQQMTRMSTAFSLITDITLLVMGAKLKFKESLSARFGDVMSYLYMASAAARHFEASNNKDDESPFMQWAIEYCLSKASSTMHDILHNYPKKFLGRVLWRLIFPYGNGYLKPSDSLSSKVAQQMRTPSSVRDELTRCCYRGRDNDPVALVDRVFTETDQAELFLKLVPGSFSQSDSTVLKTLHKMLEEDQISKEDFELLNQFLKARMQAIQVDEFNQTREANESKRQSSATDEHN